LNCDILLVEDNERVREAFTWYLRRESHCVRTASDGGDALAQMRQLRPHLVLLDIHMPGMSGLELLEVKRREAPLAGVPVVITTALPLPKPDDPCVIGIFEKMDDAAQLLRMVAPHCGCGQK
jgi:CheY-like chemotaxis protein